MQLHSIHQAPRPVPGWHALLEDLCRPPAHHVARALGIGLRTIRRYNSTGNAPQVARLALFWLTPTGRATIHAQAVYDAHQATSYLRALQDQVRDLEAQVERLARLASYGSANSPAMQAGAPARRRSTR